MYVLRTMNSFRMSFWMVPLSASCATPDSSAATTYLHNRDVQIVTTTFDQHNPKG